MKGHCKIQKVQIVPGLLVTIVEEMIHKVQRKRQRPVYQARVQAMNINELKSINDAHKHNKEEKDTSSYKQG